MTRSTKRVCTFLVGLCASVLLADIAAAAEQLDPQLAQALQRVLRETEEDSEKALASLGRLLRSYRRRPHQQVYIMEQRAGLLFQSEQFETAREELADLLRDQPPDYAPVLQLNHAKALLLLDRPDDARVVLEQWREHTQVLTGGGLFLLGYAYVRLELFEQAITALEVAMENTSTPFEAWTELLAFAYARAGRSEKAIELLEGLISLNPAKASWWRHLGVVYQNIDDAPKGSAVYSVIEQLGALTMAETRNLAGMMGYLGMPYDGAKLLAARLEAPHDPSSGAVKARYGHLIMLAKLWMSAREFEKATVVLQRASALAEDGEPWVLIGQLKLHWEQYADAFDAFKQAIRAYREEVPPRVFYLAAIAAMNLDEPEEARLALMQIEDDESYGALAERLMRQLTSRQAPTRG